MKDIKLLYRYDKKIVSVLKVIKPALKAHLFIMKLFKAFNTLLQSSDTFNLSAELPDTTFGKKFNYHEKKSI